MDFYWNAGPEGELELLNIEGLQQLGDTCTKVEFCTNTINGVESIVLTPIHDKN